MADAATDLAKDITRKITPVGTFEWLQQLLAPPAAASAPKRLPRIVPNEKGELIDLNTNKVVGRTSDAKPTLQDYLAQEQLAKAGSVMARPEQPAWRKALSPAAGTPLDLLDAILSFANPLENISGPAQAMLGPIGRATVSGTGLPQKAVKAFNQAQKKIVKSIHRADPETLKEVVADPRMLHIGVPGAGGGGLPKRQSQTLIDQVMEDAFAHYQPSTAGGTLRVHPQVMRGLDPRPGRIPESAFTGTPGDLIKAIDAANVPQPLRASGVEGLPDMAVHEATHFLNEPGYRKMLGGSGLDSKKLASALKPFITQAKFGAPIVQRHIKELRPPLAANEALSYLSQPTGRTPAATWLQQALTSRPRTGGIGQFDPQTQTLLQEALDAAMKVPGAIR